MNDVQVLRMDLIEPYQLQLAKNAIAGDQLALVTIAKNYGFWTWYGEPDLNRALQYAKRKVEKEAQE